MTDFTQNYIQQIKDDAEAITKRRLADDGVDLHAERQAEVNAMEGVTAGTPVLEAAAKNPSEPDNANFQTLSSHTGPKNVHASDFKEPTQSSADSAKQANKNGSNSTK